MENTEQILNEATEAINKEDYLSAEALLKKITSGDDSINNDVYIEALKNLGLVEVNLDNPTEAIEIFSKVLEFNKEDALSLFYLANCYSRIGEKEIAIEKFEEVLKLRPDYLDVYKTLGMIYIEFSQSDAAIEIIERALKNTQIEPDYSLYYIIATAYMLKKDYINAIENLEKALVYNSEHLPVLNSLAMCYMNTGDKDNALKTLQKAYEIDKENPLTTFNLGNFYSSIEDYKNALNYFQASYKIEPSITLLSTLGECALNAQEYPLAASLYQNLVAVYPNNPQYLTAYIEVLEVMQNYKEALVHTDTLLSFDEKNIGLTKKKGALLRKLERYEESIEVFNILLKRGKIDIEVYYNLAFNYVEIGELDNAREMFKKCITLEPNNPYAHKDLGVLYLKMNCYEWAVDEMQEAIELEDDVAEFHYSLGVAHMMLGNHIEARKALETALKLVPDDADCLAYYGYLNLVEYKKQEAFEVLQKALRIDSNNFLAKCHLAKYYFQEKKYDIAKQLLLDMTSNTKDDETMNMLGICYLETQEYSEAAAILYKLVKDYPKNHILLTNLAKAEFKIGKKQEALEHLRQALFIFDDYDEALNLLEEINNGK